LDSSSGSARAASGSGQPREKASRHRAGSCRPLGMGSGGCSGGDAPRWAGRGLRGCNPQRRRGHHRLCCGRSCGRLPRRSSRLPLPRPLRPPRQRLVVLKHRPRRWLSPRAQRVPNRQRWRSCHSLAAPRRRPRHLLRNRPQCLWPRPRRKTHPRPAARRHRCWRRLRTRARAKGLRHRLRRSLAGPRSGPQRPFPSRGRRSRARQGQRLGLACPAPGINRGSRVRRGPRPYRIPQRKRPDHGKSFRVPPR
jgi:hypothetical protein